MYIINLSLSSVQYDGKHVVSGAYDYLVKVWDPEDGSCLHTLQGHTNRVYSLQVSVGRKTIWCIRHMVAHVLNSVCTNFITYCRLGKFYC